MIKKYMIILLVTLLVWNINSLVAASPVTDPTGDHIGAIDLTSAKAEVLTMPDGQARLKLSINTASNLPGVVIFECDVDDSTGTGSNMSMTGIPITPCPCKTSSGFDIVIFIVTRQQGDDSGTAFCSGCTDIQGSCGKGRKVGQWYAMTSIGAAAGLNVGVLSGLLDPLPWQPGSGKNADCYGLPWSQILYYAHQELQGNPKIFDYEGAMNLANNKWQVSVWFDPAYAPGNQDDFMDGSTFLNVSDWLPNAGVVTGIDAGDNLTFCEGNFDYDNDVDAEDAAKLKTDLGRSALKNPCPHCR